MAYELEACRLLDEDALVARLKRLCSDERSALADILVHMAALDEREVALRKASPSLFIYCTRELGYSEDAAVYRIMAARAVSRFPGVLPLIRTGKISLRSIARLSSHLNLENYEELISKACGATRLDVERLIASLNPRQDQQDVIRQIPVQPLPGPPLQNASASPPDEAQDQSPPGSTFLENPCLALKPPRERIEPLSPGRYRFAFTGGDDVLSLIERSKQILWHTFPQGRLEDIVRQALEDLLEKRAPERQKPPRRPGVSTEAAAEHRRYIPKWVRANVWKRDGGRCAFVTSDGVRCAERSGLEYDHIRPFARGGASDEAGNIRLLCRAHNQFLARADFDAAATRRNQNPPSP